MSRRSKGLLALAGVVLAAMQFVRITRTNPPVETEIPAPDQVRAILRRACYDCHSNETAWPWYSQVAPASWLVGHDVSGGRRHVNFSTWNRLSATKVVDTVHKIAEEVRDGDMPPFYYTMPLHPRARLSPLDTSVIEAWAKTVGP
jgi:hypothetical protein